MSEITPPLQTPLHDWHVARGARMVPFAGYAMPVQYPPGIIAEHRFTRAAAGLFDVSHMGQIELSGDGADAALEALVPGDVAGLADGRQRYTLLTTEGGGIIDDLMVTRRGDRLLLVVNAGRRDVYIDHLRKHLPASVTMTPRPDLALLALQGPEAATVLQRLGAPVQTLPFMAAAAVEVAGIPAWLSRSGYTGEDGFELSVAADQAVALADALCGQPEVQPIGLGARDSLRLEAGLCLYGHDIDETTTPIEAGLAWTIGKRRRAEGGFPGADTILRQIAEGPPRKRVGLTFEGRQPAREGAPLQTTDGTPLGRVTSGGFAPSLDVPVAMGYVIRSAAETGTELQAIVRDKPIAARVAPLPFHPHRYHRP